MKRRNTKAMNMDNIKGKKCCGSKIGIIAHILLLAGIYVLSSGFLGTFSWRVVLSHPLFWGLFLIFAAICLFKKAKMHMMHAPHTK